MSLSEREEHGRVPSTTMTVRFRISDDKIYVNFPMKPLARDLELRKLVLFDISVVNLKGSRGEAIARLGNTLYIEYRKELGEMNIYEVGLEQLHAKRAIRNKYPVTRRVFSFVGRFRGGD